MKPSLLLGLVRRRQEILAWVSMAAHERASAAVVNVPLAKLDQRIFPRRDALLADWHSLADASNIGSVWPAFWRVFWATLSEPQDAAPSAMPRHTAPRVSPPATAAHPRAYKGTKFQPPKPAVAVLDLQAWLADDRLLDGFFLHHDFVRWPALDIDGQPAIALVGGEAPTVRGLLANQAEDPNTPIVFRRHFLWRLRERPADQRFAWLRLWRSAGAPSHGELLAMLARLCALDTAAHSWGELALQLSGARRSVFLLRVLERESYRLPVAQLTATQLAAFDALSHDDETFDAYIDVALNNLGRGVSAAYTLIGCQLRRRSHSHESWSQRLLVSAHCDDVPVAHIERMLVAAGENGEHWASTAWERCATQPGFARILVETQWESLSARSAELWMVLFGVSEWDFENPALRSAHWRVRLGMFPELHRHLLAVSIDYQEKFVAMLLDNICDWDDLASLLQSLSLLLPLQASLCRKPYSARYCGNYLLSSMAMHLPPARWAQLTATPEQTWLIIERACRRDNDATLARYGIHGLTEALPDFVLMTLARAPKRLMRSMLLIGCLEYHTRRRFLAEVARNPWFSIAWDQVPSMAACTRILELCLEYGIDSPLPKRLRNHLSGNATLTEAQLNRHCKVTLARLPATMLAALDAMVWRHIDGPFNLRAQSKAAHHAVRLHASIDGGNKKALRRFLLGYAEGGVHGHLEHPLNQAWYARHPRIHASVWSSDALHHVVGDGAIKIAIETDPLEVLMLGSYVGSCLGLGGMCEYSTVACLVDANKQVAYARNASGRVIARQLLAIDEQDRLVCFEVYPQMEDEALRDAFSKFDIALAAKLGVHIYRDVDKELYVIPTILAMQWWDDGHWQPTGTAVTATTNSLQR